MSILLALSIIGVGLLVGMMSAMFGVGGGVVMVPFIVLVLGESQHLAEGTSLLVMIPTALVGVIAHHRRGFVSFRTGALVGLPGIAGALTGAWVAHQIDPSTLQVYFGVFTVLVGIRVLRDGIRKRQGETGPPRTGLAP